MLRLPISYSLLGVLPLLLSLGVYAQPHGDDHGGMDMHGGGIAPSLTTTAKPADTSGPISYFAHGEHFGAIAAHIVLMVLAWFFILPIVGDIGADHLYNPGVMFSVARSYLTLPVQFLFLIVNALGLLMGVIYNSQTPDLYENNAHHKIGWLATWVIIAEVIMGLLFAYSGRSKSAGDSSYESVAFLPVPQDSPQDIPREGQHRWSGDSGQGTERSSASLRSPRSSSVERGRRMYRDGEADDFEEKPLDGAIHNPKPRRFFGAAFLDKYLAHRIPGLLPQRVLDILRMIHVVIERTILILGFIALASGGVTYGGIFDEPGHFAKADDPQRGSNIFNGLAHFIKGGIFVWYGLLTLGRWVGCFADFGWAWNVKPSRAIVGWKARIPTGEFVESFVIFLYGASNVFLEHLAAWGDAWTAQDLEHVSISIMFFGGGLCGMLAESTRLREWINTSVLAAPVHLDQYAEVEEWQPPKTQKLSLNPMPAIVILLLGLMMSSHHQASMVSTMVHSQWGMLLVGFSLARAVTYVMLYLHPPSSLLPSRPPSELVASFCLISGGLIFMLSTKDVIDAMVHYDLNAMFVFTLGMGFTAFVMAWEIVTISLKAWASKRYALPAPRKFRFPA
ncbi:conserved hypothetical protein [Uncinocarpus reesii 1704]|uniref:Integral membrane protein n=1 Tax=Uncinocarpus reesii (strain UAMH 1704) TaxID=336963 RepID=C4JSI1_UNCRE|nr:uncharacterized protein UREG_05420 [Uncinocarpus reesii 1704]EEP80578.1 conserved hypothetical protein [Uncinocarpus reesii 1704]